MDQMILVQSPINFSLLTSGFGIEDSPQWTPMTCPNRFITNLLLAMLCSYPLSAQYQASGLRSAALVRASLQGSTAIQSKQPSAQYEVDIRIAHPEYNAIGRVDALVTEGISHGTGVLINECLVLTNRHVVEGHMTKRSKIWEAWDDRMPGDPIPTVAEYPDFVDPIGKKVKFRVGYTGHSTKPFAHEIEGTVVGYGRQGAADYSPYQDWALIKLNKSVGKNPINGGVGSIALIYPDEDQVKNFFPDAEIVGFPSNKPERTITYHPNCIYDKGGGGVIAFNCTIVNGESGSPVLGRLPDKSLRIISLAKYSPKTNIAGCIDLSYVKKELQKNIVKYYYDCPK